MPTEVESPDKAIVESASSTPTPALDTLDIPTIHEDLGSLIERLCIPEPQENIAPALEVPRSDSTVSINQMTLMKKPNQYELEVLRCEWEKHREVAWHHLSMGQLKDAEYHARITLAAQESCLGARNISTMGTIHILSYIHGCQTKSSEVKTYEWMYRASLEIYGPRQPATLDSMRDLAWVYQAVNMEEKAQSLLRAVLEDLVALRRSAVNSKEHFIEESRATTDLTVLLCLQGKIVECDSLLEVLWSAVAFFTLKHRCSLRVASAMGRKLADIGEHDDTASLLTVIVQNAVTEIDSSWSSANVSSCHIVAGRATVGELLRAYEEKVLPCLAKTMAMLRKYMGFGTPHCELISREKRSIECMLEKRLKNERRLQEEEEEEEQSPRALKERSLQEKIPKKSNEECLQEEKRRALEEEHMTERPRALAWNRFAVAPKCLHGDLGVFEESLQEDDFQSFREGKKLRKLAVGLR